MPVLVNSSAQSFNPLRGIRALLDHSHLLANLVVYLLTRSRWLEELDSVNLALGIQDSVRKHAVFRIFEAVPGALPVGEPTPVP